MIKNITGSELKQMMKDNKASHYIDVRSSMEFRMNKLEGFENIPLNDLPEHLEVLAIDKPVVLICESGTRSIYAARMLRQAGFSEIYNVKGGISAIR